MLQSEFIERTGITLTSQEYVDVEELYNGVKMDKDKFCAEWKKLRNNPLFKELAEAYCHESRMHLADVNQLQAICQSLRKDFDNMEKAKNQQIEDRIKQGEKITKEFATKIIYAQCDDPKVYDIVEEEFGIAFIIRTKHEAGIPLLDEEIKYLVGKL